MTLLAGQPQEVAEILAGVVAALTIWSELADYSGKSARSLSLAADLSHLATAMHALWVGLDELNADEAEQAWRELDARATEMTRHVPAELLEYPSLQDQAEEETYGYWDQEQGAAVAKL